MAHPLSGADIGILARVFRDGGGADHRLRAEGMVSGALGRWAGKWGYQAPAPALDPVESAP